MVVPMVFFVIFAETSASWRTKFHKGIAVFCVVRHLLLIMTALCCRPPLPTTFCSKVRAGFFHCCLQICIYIHNAISAVKIFAVTKWFVYFLTGRK